MEEMQPTALAGVLPRLLYENAPIANRARARQRWLILVSLNP
jgi:hypothetical protein